MTVLEALAILEAATLECKKKDVNTPEVSESLDLLEPYIRPEWLIPQFRSHVLNRHNVNEVAREGQQQFRMTGCMICSTQCFAVSGKGTSSECYVRVGAQARRGGLVCAFVTKDSQALVRSVPQPVRKPARVDAIVAAAPGRGQQSPLGSVLPGHLVAGGPGRGDQGRRVPTGVRPEDINWHCL